MSNARPAKLTLDRLTQNTPGPVFRLTWRWWSPFAFALAYLAFDELDHLLHVTGAPMATLWPPSGLYVSALLLTPARHWPSLAFSAFATNLTSDVLLHDTAPLTSVGLCLANGTEALAGAWLARRFSGSPGVAPYDSFHYRIRGVLALLAGAVLVGPALGASIGAAVLYGVAGAPFAQTWALWCVGDALGILVMTPILLGAATLRRPRAKSVIDLTAAALAAASLMAISFFLMPASFRIAYLVLPAIVWGAVRLETHGVAAALLGASTVAATAAVLGADHFVASPFGELAQVLRIQGLLLMAGGTCHLLACVMAERKTALRRAQSAEAWLNTVIDTVPHLVWSAQPDGRIDFVNERWQKMTGMALEQLGGSGWKTVFHPDDRERASACWQHALATGQPFLCEYRRYMADGSYGWVLSRAQAASAEDGTIVRWFGTCTDIAEIVEAREVLARSRQELDILVGERTRTLHETQARLAQAQRMEALGQLAGGIAHDFNNVLQAVQGAASLLERRVDDPDAIRRLSRMVLEAAERGASITHRLLAFSRRSELTTEPVDVAALFGIMQDIFAHTLGAGVDVRVAPLAARPCLLADKGQLETVLVNLATNARDGMSGTGTLTLAASVEVLNREDCHERSPSLQPGSYVRLSVSDNGAGISPAVLSRVTEPFFTTKAVGQGTGLGLAMAKGFAEQSGGGLQIESAPGCGTVVSLWFPLAGQARYGGIRPDHHPLPAPVERPARLLLVDDDAIVRQIIAQGLHDEGYVILSSDSGAGALALLDAGENVDMVVTDLSMPGMDGIALIHQAQQRRSGLPAILLTGFAPNDVERASVGAVSQTFTLLRKPIGAKALAARVAMALDAKSPTEQPAPEFEIT